MKCRIYLQLSRAVVKDRVGIQAIVYELHLTAVRQVIMQGGKPHRTQLSQDEVSVLIRHRLVTQL